MDKLEELRMALRIAEKESHEALAKEIEARIQYDEEYSKHHPSLVFDVT